MRPIDADAMLARLGKWNTSDPTDKALYNFTLHRILEQPTIKPEPAQIPVIAWMPLPRAIQGGKNERQENDREDHRIPEADF